MDKKIEKYVRNLDFNNPASENEIEIAQNTINFKFPDDYKAFFKESNGANGEIGDYSILILWSLQEVIENNKDYKVDEFAPGLILIGSDGSGQAFAYDTRYDYKPIVQVPFIGMDLEVVEECGDTFNDFLKYLYEQE